MGEIEPYVGRPLEAQRVGLVVGTSVLGLIAVPVVLVVGGDWARSVEKLGAGVVIWIVTLGLFRVFWRTPVVRDAGIRRVTGPAHSDWTAAFVAGLLHALVWNGTIWGACGLAFWALGSPEMLPVLALGISALMAFEVVDLRRWQSDLGVVLHTTAPRRGLRLVGPRDTDKLVAVVVEPVVARRASG